MKVSIITHYYKSTNYGGNLQAYALCYVIEKIGHEVQQISFNRKKKKRINGVMSAIKKVAKKIVSLINRINNLTINKDIEKRNQCIWEFNNRDIPHSLMVYTDENIHECVNSFDAFITGSDQVWHPIAFCPAYALNFVTSPKIKLSYAASIASDNISEQYRNELIQYLKDFKGIAVRETKAAELLQKDIEKTVHVTLDPTLLLTKEEWDTICSDRIINDSYLFCYFLGDGQTERNLAEKYAKKHGLKIVTLPYLLGNYRKCDKNFGDFLLYEVSPKDFISLIKYSNYVFTDSFHAAAFSCLYHKQFVAFDRSISSSMGSRIAELTYIFDVEERFCNSESRKTFEYINSLDSSLYNTSKYVNSRNYSINYLCNILRDKNEKE